MDFTRRGFVHLLGLVGLVAAAPTVSPLFGSDEVSPLIMPDAQAGAGHYVVYAKRGIVEKIPLAERKESLYGTPVARFIRTREPGGANLRQIPPRPGVFSVRARFQPGMDPHATFYKASLAMRDRFAQFSRETLAEVPQHIRPMASLVTVVESAIHARPIGVNEGVSVSMEDFYGEEVRTDAEEDRGFDVLCRFQQFVRLAGAREGVETFQSYSEQGEFPLQVPREIDMAMLMKLDKEILAERTMAPDRISTILRRFRV